MTIIICSPALKDHEGREVIPAFEAVGSEEEYACFAWVMLYNANYLKQCDPGTNGVARKGDVAGYYLETFLNPDGLKRFGDLRDFFVESYEEYDAGCDMTIEEVN